MPKIQNVFGLYQSLPFPELDFFEHYKLSFEISELGRMKKLLPLHGMAKNLGLLRGAGRCVARNSTSLQMERLRWCF